MWHIINKEKINKINFYKEIDEALIGCNYINHTDLRLLSNKLESLYDETISYFYDVIEKNFYQDIIETIKETKKVLLKKTHWILNQIDQMKING